MVDDNYSNGTILSTTLKKNMDDKNKQAQSEQGGEGRRVEHDSAEGRNINTTNNRDISDIDRQEGTMHNGRLGGNFDEDESSKNETSS